MGRDVKSVRTYVSPRRQEQAAATRRVILEAARRLFERDGYVATSMPDVAAEAQVAVKTIYLAFRTKPELLRAVWDDRLAGREATVPVLERAWYRDIETDEMPDMKLRLLARQSAGVKSRTGRLLIVIRDAASTDPEIDRLWAEIETKLHDVSHAVVRQLADAGALNADLDVAAAADALWTLNHPSTWHLLVVQRDWSDSDYQRWLERTLMTLLLR